MNNRYPYATRYAPAIEPGLSIPRQYVYVAVSEDFSVTVGETKAGLIEAIERDIGGFMVQSRPEDVVDEDGNVIRWRLIWRDNVDNDFDVFISRERIR